MRRSTDRNVLFVIVDDLRQQLAHTSPLEGEDTSFMVTPMLDGLAREAVSFRRAHVQIAVCAPSRSSVLFGRRPDTVGVFSLQSSPRTGMCADCITLPELFRARGYRTAGAGKLQHKTEWSIDADASGRSRGFTEPFVRTPLRSRGFTEPERKGVRENGQVMFHSHATPPVRAVPAEEEADLQDVLIVNGALRQLRALQSDRAGRPWFLAVGLIRPHLPFWAPQRHFDAYPLDRVGLAKAPYCPWQTSWYAYQASAEIVSYNVTPWWGESNHSRQSTPRCNDTMPDDDARRFRQGYFAAVTHADEQIGRLFAGVKTAGVWETTVVCVWGDHGFSLGDHSSWGKQQLYHIATLSPLILRVPGVTPHDGGISEALVEAVDLMATLWDAAAVGAPPLPACPRSAPWSLANCTEGVSFLPAAADPQRSWKQVVVSQWPRESPSKSPWGLERRGPGNDARPPVMGYSVITNHGNESLRLGVWYDVWAEAGGATTRLYNVSSMALRSGSGVRIRSTQVGYYSHEFYNHTVDPLESWNLAPQSLAPGQNRSGRASRLRELSRALHAVVSGGARSDGWPFFKEGMVREAAAKLAYRAAGTLALPEARETAIIAATAEAH